MTMHRTPRLATALVAVLALSACLPGFDQVSPDDSNPWPGGTDGATGAPVAPDESRVYDQAIDWRGCGSLECATILVPIDWSNPNGQTTSLAINRLPARDQSNRIGSLLINPGGPGGSGLELTEYFASFAGRGVLDRYDVIGFDPRGVGESSPVSCGTDPELNDYYLTDTAIETQADLDRSRQVTAAFAERCRELTGPLVENVDTASAARDMDVIRALVGDDALHYIGFSYGSQLGATYAALYPDRVGHLVLDGAVDFLLPAEELSRGQAHGFEVALEAYLSDCFTQADCPFPSSMSGAKRLIKSVTDEALSQGISTGREELNGNLLVYGIVVTLYDEASWPYLTAAFDETLNQGTAAIFLELANFYLDRDTNGRYITNSNEAFTAIGCLDEPEAEEWSLAEFRDFGDVAREASPTFGWWFASSAGCEGWPWTADEIVSDLSGAAGDTPVIVIGTTGDPATPFEWAVSLAGRMPTASLLVYEGEGHTAYGRSNNCIKDAVDAYLLDDVVPDSGTRC